MGTQQAANVAPNTKLPGPRGNSFVGTRAAGESHQLTTADGKPARPEDNRFQSSQRYMKGLYDMNKKQVDDAKVNDFYASDMWFGSAKAPHPRHDPNTGDHLFRNHEMIRNDRPNPDAAMKRLRENQDAAYRRLADEKEQQIDRGDDH